MVRTAIIIAGSCLVVLLSRRSLLYPRSHGFWRFFAFELLLVLVVLNAPAWFRDPLAARQLVCWLLLMGSALLAIHAFRQFHAVGRPASGVSGGPDLAWEHTTALVTTGAYRYIRHPMYASLLLLAAGAVLKALTLPSVLLGFGTVVALVFTAKADEAEAARRFGAVYEAYRARTRMFVPWVV